MNPTFALLTLLLALAVVATPAQAIDRQDVCDLPETCEPPAIGCSGGIVSFWVSWPFVTVEEDCLPSPSSPGEESAAGESTEGGCALLEVGLLDADVGDGCAWATAAGMAEDAAEEAPV